MTLDDWLTRHGTSNAEFARLSGIGQRALVQKYRRGHMFPAAENLRRIREATNGAVTADDFVDQHAGASPPFTTTGESSVTVEPRKKRAVAAPPSPNRDEAA